MYTIVAPPSSTLFPYTTLFRSFFGVHVDQLDDPVGIAAGGGSEQLRGDLTGECDVLLQLIGLPGEEDVTLAGQVTAKRSEEHTSELQSLADFVCGALLEKKNKS